MKNILSCFYLRKFFKKVEIIKWHLPHFKTQMCRIVYITQIYYLECSIYKLDTKIYYFMSKFCFSGNKISFSNNLEKGNVFVSLWFCPKSGSMQ